MEEIPRCPAPSIVLDSWSALLWEPAFAASPPGHFLVPLGVDEAGTKVELLVNFAQASVCHGDGALHAGDATARTECWDRIFEILQSGEDIFFLIVSDGR